jgi:hypothetical protein
VSDPNYMHDYDPNRKGVCKQIVGGRVYRMGMMCV